MLKLRILVGLCATIALGGCAVDANSSVQTEDTARSGDALMRAPVLPDASLAVPAGNRLAFFFDATGVQIYGCQSSAGAYSWVFQAPEATLVDRRGHAVIQHFAGPTWEYLDKSQVVGTKIAAFTADPSAIPELLLQATGHTGKGRMAGITYIQRLDTTGGLAPTSGCDADHVGAIARVEYTATYYFYEAHAGSCR
jgi:hypothetical protein